MKANLLTIKDTNEMARWRKKVELWNTIGHMERKQSKWSRWAPWHKAVRRRQTTHRIRVSAAHQRQKMLRGHNGYAIRGRRRPVEAGIPNAVAKVSFDITLT
jgi:hypothetical protein